MHTNDFVKVLHSNPHCECHFCLGAYLICVHYEETCKLQHKFHYLWYVLLPAQSNTFVMIEAYDSHTCHIDISSSEIAEHVVVHHMSIRR